MFQSVLRIVHKYVNVMHIPTYIQQNASLVRFSVALKCIPKERINFHISQSIRRNRILINISMIEMISSLIISIADLI